MWDGWVRSIDALALLELGGCMRDGWYVWVFVWIGIKSLWVFVGVSVMFHCVYCMRTGSCMFFLPYLIYAWEI